MIETISSENEEFALILPRDFSRDSMRPTNEPENTATRRLKLVITKAEWVGYNAVPATRYVVKTV